MTGFNYYDDIEARNKIKACSQRQPAFGSLFALPTFDSLFAVPAFDSLFAVCGTLPQVRLTVILACQHSTF